MLTRFQFIASFSSKTNVKYSVFDAPTSQSIVFYGVFATPKNEFLLKVSKTIVKHTLLDRPPESARLRSGPISRHSPLTTPLVAKATAPLKNKTFHFVRVQGHFSALPVIRQPTDCGSIRGAHAASRGFHMKKRRSATNLYATSAPG